MDLLATSTVATLNSSSELSPKKRFAGSSLGVSSHSGDRTNLRPNHHTPALPPVNPRICIIRRRLNGIENEGIRGEDTGEEARTLAGGIDGFRFDGLGGEGVAVVLALDGTSRLTSGRTGVGDGEEGRATG